MHETAYRQFETLERDHWWFRGRRRIFARVLARYLPRDRPLRIADVGCGVGGMLGELSHFGSPIALDCSVDALRHCRTRGSWPLVAADATHLPFLAASLDVVALFDTIEHVPDDHAGLTDALRVLRRGGLAIVTVPAYQFLYADNDRVSQHQRRYTKRQLANRLREVGFDVLHASYYNAVLLPLIIPAVLAIKLKERLRPVALDEKTTNLSYAPPAWVNEPLTRVLATEAPFVARFEIPFGHSLLAVAQRPTSR